MNRRNRTQTMLLCFAFQVLGLATTIAEVFWDGLVSYNPPLQMFGGTEPGNAGVPITGFELRSEGTTNGYAQVTFQISSVTTLFVRDMPKAEVRTITDLKNLVDSRLGDDAHVTNRSSSLVKFDGRDATCTTGPLSNGGPAKWYCGVTFFWRQEPVWLRSSLFSVHVTAEKRATFDKLVASLKTVKIRKAAPPVKLAKEGAQLGFTQDETRQHCGEPFDVTGPNETYITEKYLIEVAFDAASNDKLAVIHYEKVRDAQKAATASRETLAAQLLPLTNAEALGILQRNAGNGKMIWSAAGHNRWHRSDGAMAALTSKGLTIATAAMWPKLHLPK